MEAILYGLFTWGIPALPLLPHQLGCLRRYVTCSICTSCSNAPIGQANHCGGAVISAMTMTKEYREQRRSVLDGLFQKASVEGEAKGISTRGPINMAYKPQI